MAKYKLHFKALDETKKSDKEKISDFLVSRGWERWKKDVSNVEYKMSFIKAGSKVSDSPKFIVDTEAKTIRLFDVNAPKSYAQIDSEALKFFDTLGYETSEAQKTRADQNIEDWFKANDSLTEQEKISAFLVPRGWEKEREVSRNIIFINANSESKYSTPELIIDTVEKTIRLFDMSVSENYAQIESDILRFFDKLGYDTAEVQKQYAKQDIEDWFKANDELSDVEKISSFLASRGWEKESEARNVGGVTSFVDTNSDTRPRLIIDLRDKTIRLYSYDNKTIKGSYEPIDAYILKFFDMLGYETDEIQKIDTGQEIEDWFKANDGLSDIEKIMAWYSQNPKITNFRKIVKKKKPEEVRFNFTRDEDHFELVVNTDDKTVEIYVFVSSKFWELVNMTSYELEFFDKLGYDLSRDAKDITDQSMEDWFAKANDEMSPIEKLTFVESFYKEYSIAFGYKYEVTKRTPDGIVITQTLIGNRSEKYKISVNIKDMLVSQTYSGSGDDINQNFMPRELEMFDKLGFDLAEDHKLATEQHIEDWFNKGKALDQLSHGQRMDDMRNALDKMGYKFVKGDARGFHIYRKPTEDGGTWLIKVSDTWYTFEKSYTPSKPFNSKINNLMGHRVAFTDEELRAIDSIGWELSSDHTKVIDQSLEDWFENKALDEIDPYIETREWLFKRGWTEYASSTPEKARYRLTDDESSILVISVEFDDMEIYKFHHNKNTHDAKREKFTNEELQFFDRLGFELNEYHTRDTGQVIEDWFSGKGLDAVDIPSAVEAWFLKRGWKKDRSSTPERARYDLNVKSSMFVIYVNFEDMEVSKFNHNKTIKATEREELTNEELQFFDSLNFDLCKAQKAFTNQTIEDWFESKGLDAMPATVEEWLLNNGYEDVTETNKLPDNYPKENRVWYYYKKDVFVFEIDPNQKSVNKYQVMSKVWKGLDNTDLDIIKFSDEELKVFDGYDYKLDSNKYYTGRLQQNIEDWFTKPKAEDMKFDNDEEIKKYILEKYKARYKEDDAVIETEDEGSRDWKFSIITKDQTKQYYASFDLKMVEVIEIIPTRVHVPMENWELKLWDNLGFELFHFHASEVNQRITDWFGEEK